MHEIDVDVVKDKEIEQAFRDAQKAENMIKYKDEIMSRPKSEWHKNFKEKKELRKQSHKDISNIKDKFDSQISQVNKNKRRRDQKREEKAANAQSSLFADDREGQKKDKKQSDKKEARPQQVGQKRTFKDA